MKLRKLAVAVAGAALLTSGAVASASASNESNHYRPPSDSLRVLASKVGLRIGTAVNPYDLNTPAYRNITASQFSSVTPENEMKWETVEPTRGTYNWAAADRLVSFAKAHGQLVRGHVLLWHNQIPSWLTTGVQNGTIGKGELRALVHKHITDEVTHFKGKIWQWDVANEFFTDANPSTMNPNDFWVANLGKGIVADAFRWAHAADPKALLFYNDYNIAGEDGSNAKFNAAYAFVKDLKEHGVPINGVGDQGHLDLQYGFPTKMTADLQQYANLGLKVAITEADVRTFVNNATDQVPTDQLAIPAHAYYYDQMLKACLFVRSCISFTVWGFADTQSWVPGVFKGEGYANIYDVNLQPKPAYTTMQQDLKLAAHGAPHRPDTGDRDDD
jgi:endo-1,4-beta-xylanase